MRLFLASLLLSAASSATAGDEWNMIWVTQDPIQWSSIKGHGALERNGNSLRGTLTAESGGAPDFKFDIRLSGKKASAAFTVISENDGVGHLKGSYKKWERPGPDRCMERIQLVNEYEYIGLSRSFTCKP